MSIVPLVPFHVAVKVQVTPAPVEYVQVPSAFGVWITRIGKVWVPVIVPGAERSSPENTASLVKTVPLEHCLGLTVTVCVPLQVGMPKQVNCSCRKPSLGSTLSIVPLTRVSEGPPASAPAQQTAVAIARKALAVVCIRRAAA